MKSLFILAATAGLLSANAAMAQSAATNSSPTPPAVASGAADSKTSAAPVAGKNSFTAKETTKRLHDHGYSQVKGLTKNADGIWMGKAVKNGAPVNVAVDYQGNITEQ
jgi:hypothetical protein